MGWTAPAPGIDVRHNVVVSERHNERSRPPCRLPPSVWIWAKHWFQVTFASMPTGQVVVRRKLRRSEVLAFFQPLPPSVIGMEACATAHHWARELAALGHEVKLMPPAYVKAYVKRNKNDAADAEAICEAVRPSRRCASCRSRTPIEQSVLMLHRARNLLVRQRTMLVNALRAHMAEFGIIASSAPQGPQECRAADERSLLMNKSGSPSLRDRSCN